MRARHKQKQKKQWRMGLYGILMLALQVVLMAHELTADSRSTEDAASNRSNSNRCSVVPLRNAMCKETEASLTASLETLCRITAGYAWMQNAVAGNPTASLQTSAESVKAQLNHDRTTLLNTYSSASSRGHRLSNQMWRLTLHGDNRKKPLEMSNLQHLDPSLSDNLGRLLSPERTMRANLHIQMLTLSTERNMTSNSSSNFRSQALIQWWQSKLCKLAKTQQRPQFKKEPPPLSSNSQMQPLQPQQQQQKQKQPSCHHLHSKDSCMMQ